MGQWAPLSPLWAMINVGTGNLTHRQTGHEQHLVESREQRYSETILSSVRPPLGRVSDILMMSSLLIKNCQEPTQRVMSQKIELKLTGRHWFSASQPPDPPWYIRWWFSEGFYGELLMIIAQGEWSHWCHLACIDWRMDWVLTLIL